MQMAFAQRGPQRAENNLQEVYRGLVVVFEVCLFLACRSVFLPVCRQLRPPKKHFLHH